MSLRRRVSTTGRSIAAALVLIPVVIVHPTVVERVAAAEPDKAGKNVGRVKHYFPETAFEYAQMVETELGVPPKVVLDDCVEIPIYVDGVQTYGVIGHEVADNPTLLGKGSTASGSVMQRYEGQTADGTPLPDVMWVAFGRNENTTGNHEHFTGSVQMIGYHQQTGATAFFETNWRNLNQWVTQDETTLRMRGRIPWIDEPEAFNQAFVTPAAVNTQCVSCHQADPFITSPFVNAAKLPGTDENVVPILDADAPFYVIGGEDWDMRTIHVQDNACFDCHRVGMKTVELFIAAGWDANDYMPPHDPGSLAEDYRELLDAWKRGPEQVAGAQWIIPPAHSDDRRVVGSDYPFKAGFNQPSRTPFAGPVGEDSKNHEANIWNAARNADIHEIDEHLANGVDVDAQDALGLTPLSLAAFCGHTETMKHLIEKGADVNATLGDGTALHGASLFGRADAVRMLVENGAQVDATNEDGRTPLEIAEAAWDKELKDTILLVAAVLQIHNDLKQTKAGRTDVVTYLRGQ